MEVLEQKHEVAPRKQRTRTKKDAAVGSSTKKREAEELKGKRDSVATKNRKQQKNTGSQARNRKT